MLKALMKKIDNLQEQIGKVNREIGRLRKIKLVQIHISSNLFLLRRHNRCKQRDNGTLLNLSMMWRSHSFPKISSQTICDKKCLTRDLTNELVLICILNTHVPHF